MEEEQTIDEMIEVIEAAPESVKAIFKRLDGLECDNRLTYPVLEESALELKKLGYFMDYDLGCGIYKLVKL